MARVILCVAAAATTGLALSISSPGSNVRAAENTTADRRQATTDASTTESLRVSAGPSLPSGRGNHAGGVVAGKAVVAGGTKWNAERTVKSFLDETLVFQDGRWTSGPALPHPIAEPMFASDARGLYVAGGRRSSSDTNDGFYRLGEADGKLRWEALRKLPEPITAGGGGILKGRFYVACGSIANVPTNRVLALDTTAADATWVELNPMPGEPRMYPAVVADDASLYVLGGMRPAQRGMEVFQDAYRYDTRSGEWSRLPDLPARGYCWAASPIDAGRILLAGRADGQIHDDVWRVRLDEMRVQIAGRAVIQTTCAPLVRVAEDTWWLVGGEPDAKKTRTEKVSVIQLGKAQATP